MTLDELPDSGDPLIEEITETQVLCPHEWSDFTEEEHVRCANCQIRLEDWTFFNEPK